MSTSRSMFADWYREADLNPTSESISVRLESIGSIIKRSSIDFWLDIIKIYLGCKPSEISFYSEFCNEFKKTDPTFPLQNNDNLIRVLAACSICVKLDEDIAFESDALSLAILTSNFLGQYTIESRIPVLENAFKYLYKESIRFRKPDSNLYIDEDDISFSPIIIDAEKADEVFDQSHVEEPINNINATVAALVERVNTLSNEVANHQKIQSNLLEEVNILWWVFGEHSAKLQKRFKDIGFLQTVLISPFELSDFIAQSPSYVSISPILNKVLKLGHNKESKFPAISLSEIVGSVDEILRKSLHKNEPEKLLTFTPCLLGIKKSLDVDEGEDWSSSFRKATQGADINKKKSAIEFAEEIFKELQFIRSYHLCS